MNLPPVHKFAAAPADAPVINLGPKIPKVFFAVCSGDWKPEFYTTESIRAIANQCKCETVVRFMANDGVARARNNLTWSFLQTDCTHLFFLDSDIIIEPFQFQRMLDSGKSIVCGIYPKKQGELDWVVNYLPDKKVDEKGFLSIKHAGTGCLLIERSEIELQIKNHPEMRYTGDPDQKSERWDLFPMHAVDGHYESEDWAFCNRLRADEREIWMDTQCQLRHVGKIVFPLQFTLTDEEVVNLIYHRYGIWPDHIRTFFGSGHKPPSLMGGHRARPVRLWPHDFKNIPDLHEGDIMAGGYDVPINPEEKDPIPSILDIGAGIGAFARWAARRWKGARIHCFEDDPVFFPYLERILGDIKKADGQVIDAKLMEIQPKDVELLPRATILKIDLPGRERSILEALQACDRLKQFDAVIVRYHSEMDAFSVNALMSGTHAMHCNQRFYRDEKSLAGEGVIKFIHRDVHPVPLLEKQD